MPQIRSDLDVLGHQLTRISTNTVVQPETQSKQIDQKFTNQTLSSSTLAESDQQSEFSCELQPKLNMLHLANTKQLEDSLMWSEKRLAEATKEVEQE